MSWCSIFIVYELGFFEFVGVGLRVWCYCGWFVVSLCVCVLRGVRFVVGCEVLVGGGGW